MRILTIRRSPLPLMLAATLLAAFVMLFAWPQAAAAHDELVDSDPAADSTVETLPEELTLTFSAALVDGEGATEVVVTDADGNSVTDGEPTVDGAMVIQPLASGGIAGEYHVKWRVVSSDGHPTAEEFFFTVNTGTENTGTEPTPSAAPTEAATPTTEASATPDATTTPPEAGSSSGASAWIWALSIGGIAVISVLTVWFIVRAKKNGTPTDSDDPTER